MLENNFYINSKGESVNPMEMATPHLNSALAKAQRENNQHNIEVLEAELNRREANNTGMGDLNSQPDTQ